MPRALRIISEAGETYIIEAVFIYVSKNSNDVSSTERQFGLGQKAHDQQL